MSGAPENNRWSRGGPQHQQQQQSARNTPTRPPQNHHQQQDRSGTSTPRSHDGPSKTANANSSGAPNSTSSNSSNRQSMNLSGGAWGSGRTASGAGNRASQVGPPPPPPQQQQQQQQQLQERKKEGGGSGTDGAVHVPVKGFNAEETRALLGKGYKDAIAAAPGAYIKVEGDSVAKRSSGVWASKLDTRNMANGQNFWTQLSLQVQKLEQGK